MLPRFFINRPIFAWVIALSILLAGALVFPKLLVSQYPEVAPPALQITAVYPGASAQVVEDTVTALVEQEMNGLDDLLYMDSNSDSNGVMTLTLTFESGTDLDIASVAAQDRIKRVDTSLPTVPLSAGDPIALDVIFNGVDVTGTGEDSFSQDANGKIGAKSASSYGFDGKIDELRVSNVERNTSWLQTGYNNQNNPAVFCSRGSEEVAGWTNNVPTFSSPSPVNGSIGVNRYPATSVMVTDSDTNQTLTVTFYSGAGLSGPWTLQQTNVSTPTRTSPFIYRDVNASYASGYSTPYYWRVTAYDGLVNKSHGLEAITAGGLPTHKTVYQPAVLAHPFVVRVDGFGAGTEGEAVKLLFQPSQKNHIILVNEARISARASPAPQLSAAPFPA